MDSANDEDSINRLKFTQEVVFGKAMDLSNISKIQGIIIRLRENQNLEASKNKLIEMLEELLGNDSASEKKQKLENKFGMIMKEESERRLNTMCNLSEALVERTYKQGIEQGMQQGIEEQKRIDEQIIESMAKKIQELESKLNIAPQA